MLFRSMPGSETYAAASSIGRVSFSAAATSSISDGEPVVHSTSTSGGTGPEPKLAFTSSIAC